MWSSFLRMLLPVRLSLSPRCCWSAAAAFAAAAEYPSEMATMAACCCMTTSFSRAAGAVSWRSLPSRLLPPTRAAAVALSPSSCFSFPFLSSAASAAAATTVAAARANPLKTQNAAVLGAAGGRQLVRQFSTFSGRGGDLLSFSYVGAARGKAVTSLSAASSSVSSRCCSALLLPRRAFAAAAAAGRRGGAAVSNQLLLTLSSPSEAIYVKAPVHSITVPGSEGVMTLTNGHSQMVARLKAGEVIVRRNAAAGGGSSSDASAERFFLSDGFLLFSSSEDESGCSTAEVLAVELVPVDVLDKEKAVAALQTLLQQGAGATDEWTKARTLLGQELLSSVIRAAS